MSLALIRLSYRNAKGTEIKIEISAFGVILLVRYIVQLFLSEPH